MWLKPPEILRSRFLCYAAVCLFFTGLSSSALVHSNPYETTVNVVSYGGAYTKSQMLAYVRPWEAATGKVANMIDYGGGLDEIKSQVESANVIWDVVDIELANLINACNAGLLEPTDLSLIENGADGTPASEDIPQAYMYDCGYPSVIWSTVIGYNENAFDGEKPSTVSDFFNIEEFPGNRGLRRSPAGLLEWALISDGVAPADVYSVLSTPQGVDYALDIASVLKPHIVWWSGGGEPAEMLSTGRVSMSTAWNGRLYGPIVDQGQPLGIIWDRQMIEVEFWAIPKGSPRLENAKDFIRFAMQTENMANQTKHISYGPVRNSAQSLIEDAVKPYLPTSNLDTAFKVDSEWWAQNMEHISASFERWLTPKPEELERQVRF